jgi:hypothetical protein
MERIIAQMKPEAARNNDNRYGTSQRPSTRYPLRKRAEGSQAPASSAANRGKRL